MSKYIDRDELIKGRVENDPVRIAALCEPAADVAPVVHGKWVRVSSSDLDIGKAYICSNCKKMRYGSYQPPFCQVCGARMEDEV